MRYPIAPRATLTKVPGVALVVSHVDGTPLAADLGPVSGDRFARLSLFRKRMRETPGQLWERVAESAA